MVKNLERNVMKLKYIQLCYNYVSFQNILESQHDFNKEMYFLLKPL